MRDASDVDTTERAMALFRKSVFYLYIGTQIDRLIDIERKGGGEGCTLGSLTLRDTSGADATERAMALFRKKYLIICIYRGRCADRWIDIERERVRLAPSHCATLRAHTPPSGPWR